MEMEAVLQTLKRFLDSENRLKQMPSKYKMKLYAMYYLASKLEPGKQYTEMELNEALGQWNTFGDPATIRREMFDFQLIDRERSGRAYWLKEGQPNWDEIETKAQ